MNDKLIVSVSPHYHKQDASTQALIAYYRAHRE